jgi:hypothetical protein
MNPILSIIIDKLAFVAVIAAAWRHSRWFSLSVGEGGLGWPASSRLVLSSQPSQP